MRIYLLCSEMTDLYGNAEIIGKVIEELPD